MLRKNTVAIVNQELVPVLKSNCLTQLLQRPGGTRMRSDVTMDQASAAVLESSRRRSLLTCARLRTGLASWPRIRLKHGESPSFKEPAPLPWRYGYAVPSPDGVRWANHLGPMRLRRGRPQNPCSRIS